MKVFVAAPATLSRAMRRVARALARHAPAGVAVVDREADADVVLLHVVGYDDAVREIDRLIGRGQDYAVAQYCLRTTQRQTTDAWREVWGGAEVVWSYYDLPGALRADGVPEPARWNFYQSPLGLDDAFAAAPSVPRACCRRAVMTSGYVSAGQEPIWEMAAAAERVGRPTWHVGPPAVVGMPRRPAGWQAFFDVSDPALARLYGAAAYVSGMRYVEAFELPAAEGLACGARPICFDRPDARRWYDGLAAFVPEASEDALIASLAAVLAADPAPVSLAEHAVIRARFSWATIADGFWRALAGKAVSA